MQELGFHAIFLATLLRKSEYGEICKPYRSFRPPLISPEHGLQWHVASAIWGGRNSLSVL